MALLEYDNWEVKGRAEKVPTVFVVAVEVARAWEDEGRPVHVVLADEFIAAYKREGAAMTKRENVHRMAEANKAFAHFAW